MTSTFNLLARMVRQYMAPHKRKLALAFVCMVLTAVGVGVFVHLIQPLFDDGFIGRDFSLLVSITALMVFLYALKGVAQYFQGFYMEYIGQRIIADMQADLYAHVIKQDPAFYQNTSTAELSSRFLSDIQRLKLAVGNIFSGGLRDSTLMFGLVVNLFSKDALLAVVSLVVIPLAAYPFARFGKLMRKYSQVNQARTGLFAQRLYQTLGYAREVQAYTRENDEITRTNRAIEDVFTTTIKAARVRAATSPVMEMIGMVAIVAVVILGGWRVHEGVLTTGAFVSFLTTLLLVLRPLKGLSNLNNIVQEGLAAADRTFEVMDTHGRVQTQPTAKQLVVQRAEVRFENVSLTYPDGKAALQHISFTIPAGTTAALVGYSGSGKSTALNLLPRFYDPTAGRILINGEDIKNFTLESLRAHIALVAQDPAIFDDTVLHNITYGKPTATQTEVEAAAIAAMAHDFIMQLTHGYNTRLGEDGVKLSGGQKSRIAIARALLKNAPILLLDEATASLDSASEKQVQQALMTLMRNRTTLVVAHRLSTITEADCIYVLENGRVIEQGTHTQLLANSGRYAALWALQGK